MTTINLYQPGKINIYLQFPTEWDELLPAEVVEVCKQQLLLPNNIEAAKASIFHFIIRTRAKLQKEKLPTGWVSMMDAEQAVLQAYPILDFLYTENNLTQTPEVRIKLPGLLPLTVQGPQGFNDLTCGEYEDADIHFNSFFAEPGAEALAKLAAVLWRPRRKPYVRVKNKEVKTYNSEKLIKRFLKLPPWRLYAVFVWFAGSKSQLPLIFPTVYEKHADDPVSDEPDPLAFTRCIHAGAGVKNGSRNEIRMTRLYEFMFEMEEEATKAKQLKAAYDEQRSK